MQHRALLAGALATLAVSSALGLTGCVDSSVPSSPASTIAPSAWTFRPGKMQTFTASDPNDPSATFLWSAPPEVKNLAQSPNQITLVAKSAIGNYELFALSSSNGTKAGVCKLEVVDYSFGFSLKLGYTGAASNTVYGDVDVVPGTTNAAPAPGDAGKIWVAYLNDSTAESFVKLYDSDFSTELHSIPAVFSTTKLPEIAANEQGTAFWIETIPGVGDSLVRARTDGTSDHKPLANILPQQLTVLTNTDIAVTPSGDLVFECFDSQQGPGIYRIEGAFGATPKPVFVFSSGNFANVQLAVDSAGRVLIADNEVPTLYRVTGEGTNATIENLEQIQNSIVDVDEDPQGALYVTTPDRVIVLDTEGDVVLEITGAEVPDTTGTPVFVAFESLVSSSIDSDGNLRVIDGRSTDNPNLPIGVVASYVFTIDLQ